MDGWLKHRTSHTRLTFKSFPIFSCSLVSFRQENYKVKFSKRLWFRFYKLKTNFFAFCQATGNERNWWRLNTLHGSLGSPPLSLYVPSLLSIAHRWHRVGSTAAKVTDGQHPPLSALSRTIRPKLCSLRSWLSDHDRLWICLLPLLVSRAFYPDKGNNSEAQEKHLYIICCKTQMMEVVVVEWGCVGALLSTRRRDETHLVQA